MEYTREFVGEVLGTFVLVLFGCGAVAVSILRLPSEAGKPGVLKEARVTPVKGKTIRIARALPGTAGSEGSDRK